MVIPTTAGTVYIEHLSHSQVQASGYLVKLPNDITFFGNKLLTLPSYFTKIFETPSRPNRKSWLLEMLL